MIINLCIVRVIIKKIMGSIQTPYIYVVYIIITR